MKIKTWKAVAFLCENNFFDAENAKEEVKERMKNLPKILPLQPSYY